VLHIAANTQMVIKMDVFLFDEKSIFCEKLLPTMTDKSVYAA